MRSAGRFRLLTKPNLTGSSPILKTMGMVVVAALAARAVTAPPPATINATWRVSKRPTVCRCSVSHSAYPSWPPLRLWPSSPARHFNNTACELWGRKPLACCFHLALPRARPLSGRLFSRCVRILLGWPFFENARLFEEVKARTEAGLTVLPSANKRSWQGAPKTRRGAKGSVKGQAPEPNAPKKRKTLHTHDGDPRLHVGAPRPIRIPVS